MLSVTGVSTDDIALNVSSRAVYNYMKLLRDYGDVVPVTRRNGPRHLVGEQEATVLLKIILENPGIYLHEIQEELFSNCGVWLHPSTICKEIGCIRQSI